MRGSATAVLIGQVVLLETTASGYRLRIVVVERQYDRRTQTKVERSSWLWCDGRGPPPSLKKHDVVCVEAHIRSLHTERDEMVLEIERICRPTTGGS